MQTLSANLPSFAGSQAVAFVLVMCRVGGLFVLAPIFSATLIPMQAKLMIAGAISFALMPMVAPEHVPTGLAVVPLMVKEIIVGLAFALVLGVIGAAVQFAASIMDTMIGFSYAALIDPMSNAPAAILGQFYSLFSVLVFLLIGGDQLMILGLDESYKLVPIGTMPSFARLGALATVDLTQIAVIGLELGAPVIIALVLVDVAFALVARAVPQMNVFVVGLPGKILVGFGAIAASLAVPHRRPRGSCSRQADAHTALAERSGSRELDERPRRPYREGNRQTPDRSTQEGAGRQIAADLQLCDGRRARRCSAVLAIGGPKLLSASSRRCIRSRSTSGKSGTRS